MRSTDDDTHPARGGLSWDECLAGMEFVTSRRTVYETDLVNYVNGMGFLEPLFVDAEHLKGTSFTGRLIPALLTLSIAEGLVIQTGMLHSTAVALLSIEMTAVQPAYVGDTLSVRVTIAESRPTSKGPDRGVVTSRNQVVNQSGRTVLEYTPRRLIRGRAAPVAG